MAHEAKRFIESERITRPVAKPAASYVREEGGRGVEDMEAMQRSRESGECEFCKIIAGKMPEQPVLFTYRHWLVFENIRPEDHTSLHLVAAAAIPRDHAPDFTFDDLSEGALIAFGPLIRQIKVRFEIEDGRSMFMRIGANGDMTAQTVMHPHFHIVVSDGLPVEEKRVFPTIRQMLEGNRSSLIAAFRAAEPALYVKHVGKGDEKLWSETLKFVWRNIGLLRSHLDGKAGEIRPKFSNKATKQLPKA